jgi:hypothetical protein
VEERNEGGASFRVLLSSDPRRGRVADEPAEDAEPDEPAS